MIRKANAIRKKIKILVYGEQGTGKSRLAMQMCYLNLGTVCHPYKVWNTAITDWQGLWHPKESAKSQGNCYL